MYLPSIGPRDPHRLWSSHPDTFSHTIRPRSSSDIERNRRRVNTANINRGGSPATAGSLSGSNPIFALERDEQFRSNHYNSIRTFGYDYLKPPGLGKTLQALIDATQEEEDSNGSGGNVNQDDGLTVNEEQTINANNGNTAMDNGLDGIVIDEVFQTDTGNTQGLPGLNETQFIQGFSSDNDNDDIGNMNDIIDELSEEERNLDDEIPSADEDNYSYGDDYNDNEYDDGFMAQEEEYEDHEGNATMISDDRSFIQTPASHNQGHIQSQSRGRSRSYSYSHRRNNSSQLLVPPHSSPYPHNFLETPVPTRTRITSPVNISVHSATPTPNTPIPNLTSGDVFNRPSVTPSLRIITSNTTPVTTATPTVTGSTFRSVTMPISMPIPSSLASTERCHTISSLVVPNTVDQADNPDNSQLLNMHDTSNLSSLSLSMSTSISISQDISLNNGYLGQRNRSLSPTGSPDFLPVEESSRGNSHGALGETDVSFYDRRMYNIPSLGPVGDINNGDTAQSDDQSEYDMEVGNDSS
ncbi:hypothetical protein NADFUDRAFT_82163 [Nadsonia fulvescens var. elongata DSM 6958]|uniref:Uncharacterized protein n=1 Tax=Nadsonia fulvescens var. elongata DSM 6958 TaxID=857566 RepID=A0A1E3PLJ2_9ASCO|nr:hypothetical protein NADFUDRAFT_82163 [Nadsonia fulvescens var. elongata DSM 6958]